MALFEFGEQHAGQVLSAGDCLSMFDRGTVGRSGLLKQMSILLGWWTPKRLGGCQSLFTWSVGLVPFEARCFTGFQPPSLRLQSSPSEHCLNGYDTLGAVGYPV